MLVARWTVYVSLTPGGYVARSGPLVGQQPHRRVRRRDHLGAVGGLQRRLPPGPPSQPPPGERGGRRERGAVHPRHDPQRGILHGTVGWWLELAQPAALPVPVRPGSHRLAQVVQLRAALVPARPRVGQRATELGVPHQRRQVLDGQRHAHVVDRAVRRHPDRVVGQAAAPEQPQVAGAGEVDGLVQRHDPDRHG
jgi:hypothetical protein